MGRKGKWFLAVRKVFGHQGNEDKNQRNHRSKRTWNFCKPKPLEPLPSESIETSEPTDTSELIETAAHHDAPPPVPPSNGTLKLIRHEEDANNHAYSVARASVVAAEAASIAAKAAAEVVRLTAATRPSAKSNPEIAAVEIQTAFRGYQARRAFRGLRGLVRLKTMLDGNAVQRQTAHTLWCMQTLARLQSQIRSRRIRMTEENQSLLRQLQLKHERELEKIKLEEEWDDRTQSKEQIEAKILNKHEAANRRERALAYAFSHQWKSSSRGVPPKFTDPNNTEWGWSWLERWMATRPWENRITTETNDRTSVKSVSRSVVAGETSKNLPHRNNHAERTPAAAAAAVQKPSRPASRHESPPTPPAKLSPTIPVRKKTVSPRGVRASADDDSRSMESMQSERHRRRNSIGGSSARDDESLASTPSVPHYLTSTQSVRAKSRFQSSPSPETAEKVSSPSSAKKRLSFPTAEKHRVPSPVGTRRHSGPPMVDVLAVKSAVNT